MNRHTERLTAFLVQEHIALEEEALEQFNRFNDLLQLYDDLQSYDEPQDTESFENHDEPDYDGLLTS